MKWLIQTALRLRVIVAIFAIVLMIVGLRTIGDAPLDVFPEFAPPRVEIQTEGPGMSSAEVESLITVPIENSLNGILGVETIRSKSVLGLSSVVLYFDWGADLLQARQLVQERLATLMGDLPSVARTPVILAPLSSTSRVLKIGLSSGKMSQIELTTLARWTIRPRLMAISGVANVAIWGQRDRQLQVLVDPQHLRDHGVTLDDIIRATRQAVEPQAGGFIDTPNQRLAITHVASVTTAEDLRRVPVKFRNGVPTNLEDVAVVEEGFPPPIGDAIINDGPGLLLIVEKQPTGNTLDVTREVETALQALSPALQDVAVDTTIFRPATFIEMSLDNLQRALLIGCLLVIVVLIVFLSEWRTALISLLAIPISLVAALLIIYYRGDTINTMVLAGLAIALGSVVDDAIIDVENITRRLRQNREAGGALSAFRVVLNASMEVRSAVVFASLIVVLVFLPVFFLEGLAGAFFRPLATSYILAVLASLVVALTLTPALSLILLPTGRLRSGDSVLIRLLRKSYRTLLPPVLNRPLVAMGVLGLIYISAFGAVPFLGEEFLPDFQEYDFLMHWVEKPGTSIEAMRRITIQASKELRTIPGVRNFGAHIGRAEVADEVVGPNFTELWISLDPSVDYQPTIRRIQDVVDGYPGLYRDLLTYLKERIKEVLTGSSAALVVRLYGPDLGLLRVKAREAAEAMADISGVADLHVEQQVLIPQIEMRVLAEQARRFGLTSGQVRQSVATLIQGLKVGEIYDDQKIFDVTVWGVPDLRHDVFSLGSIRIDTPSGANIPLRDVVDIRIAPTSNSIAHENGSRKIDVSCNVRGNDLGKVAREIEGRVLALDFPNGYHPEFLGEYAARQESRNRLIGFGALSLLGIFLILYSDFQSGRISFLIFFSLPFALVGGVLAAFLMGGVLSLGSLLGFVTVIGIASRNGILLVSHYRHLEHEEGLPFGRDLIIRGSEERLSPILMTATTTALALLPIALGGSKPGHEIEYPMAVIIIGGLVTSTLLNLVVMPVLYEHFGKSRTGR